MTLFQLSMATNSSDANASVLTTMATTTTIEQYFGFSFYICVVECCLSLLTLLGNGLTVVIVTKYLKKVSPTHVTVTYLAIADFTVGMMPWFHFTTYLTQGFKAWRNWCTLAAWFNYFSSCLNIVAVMFVSLERCFLITEWDLYQKKYTVTKQNVISGISASCVLLAVMADIALSDLNPKLGRCYFNFVTDENVLCIISHLLFVIISFILVLSYVRIIYFLWKQRKSVEGMSISQSTRGKKTTILMALIVSIYLSTTVPLMVYSQTLPDVVMQHQIETLDIFICIFYCNAIVNTILYAARIPMFKEAYGKIFGQTCKLGRS